MFCLILLYSSCLDCLCCLLKNISIRPDDIIKQLTLTLRDTLSCSSQIEAAMTYTVKKLAKLSGVSVRTLHFYDEIGLLKPAYYGDNHYRYYEEEQLLMLQQILFYRKLGFSLNDIKNMIGSDDFNKIDALISHKQILIDRL